MAEDSGITLKQCPQILLQSRQETGKTNKRETFNYTPLLPKKQILCTILNASTLSYCSLIMRKWDKKKCVNLSNKVVDKENSFTSYEEPINSISNISKTNSIQTCKLQY